MRIAIVGPFSGTSLSSHFHFPSGEGRLAGGYPGAPMMSVLARVLADRGHCVAAITTDQQTPPKQLDKPFRVFQASSLSAYFCPQRSRGYRYSNGRWGRAVDLFAHERRALIAAIRDFDPDVIHANWTYEFAWAALDSGYPVLVTAHDSPLKVLRFMPDLYRMIRFAMARHVISRCSCLTAVSPDLAKDLVRFTGLPITVVPNPVAVEVLAGPGCTDRSFHSGSVMMVLNGWNGLKNGAMALRAFNYARRSKPDLRLACYGVDWEGGGPAHEWATRNQLTDGVDFRGTVTREEILSQMRSSTMLLHPSRTEACSMVIAEAMSVGMPVVAGRRTDGVPWQLDDGRAGILVDVGKPHEVARGIVELARSREIWTAVSLAARARARELFSADRVADHYAALYAGLLAGLHPPSVAQAELT